MLDIEIGDRVGGVDHHGNFREPRNDLLEIRDPLANKLEAEIGKTRRVAARMADALDELGPDRVGDVHEHHRDGRGGFLDIGGRTAHAHQHVGSESYEFGSHALEFFRFFIGETVNEFDFFLAIAKLFKSIEQAPVIGPLTGCVRGVPEDPDLRHAAPLLRTRHDRPRRRARDQRHHVTTLHFLALQSALRRQAALVGTFT